MHFRRPTWRLTAFAALAAAAAATAGCGLQDPALQSAFSESPSESALPMPKATVEGDPKPQTTLPTEPDEPCATNDMVVAACLAETTALAPLGGQRAAVGAGKELLLVARGAKPQLLATFDSTIRQILPSRTVAEDGQIWVLLHDGSVKRVTMMGSGKPDISDNEGLHGVEVILLDSHGEISALRRVSDQYFKLVSACQDPESGQLVLTGYEYGLPMVANWAGGQIAPVGTVDTGEEIGGCQVQDDNLLVAGPQGEKVMHQHISQTGLSFEFVGQPTTAVNGEFGRIQAVGVSNTGAEELFWISTSNKSPNATKQPDQSDDRVIIVPGGSASGASPD